MYVSVAICFEHGQRRCSRRCSLIFSVMATNPMISNSIATFFNSGDFNAAKLCLSTEKFVGNEELKKVSIYILNKIVLHVAKTF